MQEVARLASLILDAASYAVILLAVAISTIAFLTSAWRTGLVANYREYRANLGRGILTGLELLIAADILRSVVIDPSLDSMLVLGGIVLIRTFLSISLEVEINGHWPWDTTRLTQETQRGAQTAKVSGTSSSN
jgi:uncharacterized membrane protein